VASFNADVILNTSVNQVSLNKAIRSISQVNNLVKQLKPVNLFAPGSGAGADKIKTGLEEILKISKQINAGQKGRGGLARTLAGANNQANAFLETLQNVNIQAKDGSSKAKIEQFAQAFVKAEKEAKEYEKTLNDIIRKAKGLQPQDVRDQEVRNRVALVKRLRQEKAEERRADQRAIRDGRKADRDRVKAARDRKREIKKIRLEEERIAKSSLKRIGAGAVGAGFPLLFGGGPGGVLGGLLGGVVGGQQFGFEASLGLSALGTQLDKVGASALNLARNLSNPSDLLEELSTQGFKVTQSIKDNVAALEEQGRVADAARIAQEKLAEKIGTEGVEAFKEFDRAATELQNSAATLSLTILTELSPAIVGFTNFVDTLVKSLTGPIEQRRFANENPAAFQQIQTQAATEIASRDDFGKNNYYDRLRYEARVTELVKERSKVTQDTVKIEENSSLQFIQNNNLAKQARERAKDAAKEELKFVQEMYRLEQQRANLAADRLQDTINFIRERTRAANEAEQTVIRNREAKNIGQEQIQRQMGEAGLTLFKQGEASLVAQARSDVNDIYDLLLKIEKTEIAREADRLRVIFTNAQVPAKTIETILANYTEVLEDAAEAANKLNKRMFKTDADIAAENLSFIEQQITIEKAITKEERKQAELELVLMRLRAANANLSVDQLADLENATRRLFDLQNQEVDSLAAKINTTLASAMENALIGTITAAIQGTEDLGEKLQALASDLLGTLGRIFINAGISGLAGPGGLFGANGLPGFRADGGPVTANQPYIIGERGPELFVPGNSGTVVSNESLSRYNGGNTAGGGGSRTIHFQSEIINNVEYVTASQAMAMSRAAADDGAKRGAAGGHAKTMNTLQNSRSSRSRIGMS